MTTNRVVIIAVGLVTTFGVAWLAVACGPKARDQPKASATISVPAELELLNDIRGQIGSPLEASLFQDAGAATSFDKVYAQAARDAPNVGDTSPRFSDVSDRERPVDPAQHYSASLRDAARTLDIGAADLEDAGQYEQADALRAWATKLRSDARKGQTQQ